MVASLNNICNLAKPAFILLTSFQELGKYQLCPKILILCCHEIARCSNFYNFAMNTRHNLMRYAALLAYSKAKLEWEDMCFPPLHIAW